MTSQIEEKINNLPLWKKFVGMLAIFLLTIGFLYLRDALFKSSIGNEQISIVKKNSLKNELLKSDSGTNISSRSLWGGYDCERESNFKCVDLEEFGSLCEVADVVTNETVKKIGKYPYAFTGEDIQYLLDNGGYKGYKLEMVRDYKNRPICEINIRVTGIYKGSQVDKLITGYITSFVISDGSLLTFDARVDTPFTLP